MSIKFACPACYTVLSAPESAAGKKAKCKKCEKVVSIPEPQTVANTLLPEPQTAPTPPIPPGDGRIELGGIRTTMIVSGILNVIAAVVWFVLSIGVCFPVYGALIMVAVAEFVVAANMPNTVYGAKTARTLAIIEIVAGLASFPSFICGIINFISAGRLTGS